jgi:hypothetical protein
VVRGQAAAGPKSQLAVGSRPRKMSFPQSNTSVGQTMASLCDLGDVSDANSVANSDGDAVGVDAADAVGGGGWGGVQ